MNDGQINKLIHAGGGNFTPDEFLPGRDGLKKKIISEFVAFRNWHGISTQITSAHRTSGSHQYGTAIDFLLWDDWRKTQPDIESMWRIATTWPWMGVGIYFDWNDGIGFHVDLCTPQQRQRPLRWLREKGKYHYQNLENGRFYHADGSVVTLQRRFGGDVDPKPPKQPEVG